MDAKPIRRLATLAALTGLVGLFAIRAAVAQDNPMILAQATTASPTATVSATPTATVSPTPTATATATATPFPTPTPTPTTSALPKTGSRVYGLAVLALSLILGGLCFIALDQKHRLEQQRVRATNERPRDDYDLLSW